LRERYKLGCVATTIERAQRDHRSMFPRNRSAHTRSADGIGVE
jgi:hypothetical protein